MLYFIFFCERSKHASFRRYGLIALFKCSEIVGMISSTSSRPKIKEFSVNRLCLLYQTEIEAGKRKQNQNA